MIQDTWVNCPVGNGGGGASQLVVWSMGTKDLERQTGVVEGSEKGTMGTRAGV